MMKNPLRKIGLILTALFLVPALFFTALEINALKESERVLENIYLNQLESILLSVNRFSDDVLNNWTNEFDAKLSLNKNNFSDKIAVDFLTNKTPLENLFYVDTSLTSIKFFPELINDQQISAIDYELKSNREKISRLINYSNAGYRKLEPLGNIGDSLNVVLFILTHQNQKMLFGYLIDPEIFINLILSPKIQEVTKDDIVIKCIRNSDNNIIYSTDKYFDEKEISAKKEFWLFPNFQIGITLKGESLQEIIKSRSYINLSLLATLNFLLLIALVFLYRSIKKEIHFAQLKSEFVSNVSHELRTPLALISMFAETLELGRVKTEEKKNEYYTIISQETQRLSKIVNSILNFSKMESGKRKYNLNSGNVNSTVEKVLSTYQFHLKNKGFDVEVNLQELLPDILIDEEAISECLINLIDNGVKYSTKIKRLEISTELNNSKVCINVKDFGIGINKLDQQKVFDKFYRVPSNLVHNTKGTGLGLSIVFQIMHAHNGNIIVKSEPEKGSTFTLCFPIKKN